MSSHSENNLSHIGPTYDITIKTEQKYISPINGISESRISFLGRGQTGTGAISSATVNSNDGIGNRTIGIQDIQNSEIVSSSKFNTVYTDSGKINILSGDSL